MRQFSLDLVRVTEAAAIAAAAWVGSGNKILADRDATDAMRDRLNSIDFCAMVQIGEGKKDESYGLFNGERVGANKGEPEFDIAVDPIDGTRPTVTSGPEAISVMAVGKTGSMFCTEEHYMHKLAYGPACAEQGDLNILDPLDVTLRKVSKATGKDLKKLIVCILDRDRHADSIAKMRALGVRIKLIQDCDISGAISACRPESGIDLCVGIGGAPEAVITAAAMKCLGGGFQAQIVNKKDLSLQPRVFHIEDLMKGDCTFVATGITDGSLLRGVRTTERGPLTHSIVMRSESGTMRFIEARHGN
jgi:fructose-1,6-bisphosphatase II